MLSPPTGVTTISGTEGASLPANLSGNTYRTAKATLKSVVRCCAQPPTVKIGATPTRSTR
jgi:hypothetical protein